MTTTLPAGWMLAPVDPTIDMLAAADNAGSILSPRALRIYVAMLGAAPTPPASAQPARDWELDCDHCNGSGHVFVKHQVAERETDVQEFKEECEECDGRGFTIAFQDIPGIAEYVKSCRPAPATTQARTGNTDDHQEGWFAGIDHERAEARAGAQGDVRDAERYRWLCDKFGVTKLPCAIERIIEGKYVADGKESIDAAIDAALSASQQQEG